MYCKWTDSINNSTLGNTLPSFKNVMIQFQITFALKEIRKYTKFNPKRFKITKPTTLEVMIISHTSIVSKAYKEFTC